MCKEANYRWEACALWLTATILQFTSIAPLALAPLQLAAEHIKKCAARVQKLHVILGFAAIDVVAVIDRHPRLAVDAEVGLFITGHDHDFNLRRVAHNERAMGQRMG